MLHSIPEPWVVRMLQIGLSIPLTHHEVHEVTGGGVVYIPLQGVEDTTFHEEDFVTGVGVGRCLGELLDATDLNFFLFRCDV